MRQASQSRGRLDIGFLVFFPENPTEKAFGHIEFAALASAWSRMRVTVATKA
jgi:hypothetical protein